MGGRLIEVCFVSLDLGSKVLCDRLMTLAPISEIVEIGDLFKNRDDVHLLAWTRRDMRYRLLIAAARTNRVLTQTLASEASKPVRALRLSSRSSQPVAALTFQSATIFAPSCRAWQTSQSLGSPSSRLPLAGPKLNAKIRLQTDPHQPFVSQAFTNERSIAF
jgi:hypothetical protein